MTSLVPYTMQSPALPRSRGEAILGIQGVHITLEPEAVPFILEKVIGWFEGRPEVAYVDHGVSDKQGIGYIILEWSHCEVDPLFVAILRDEDVVLDYTVYARDEQED